MATIRAHDSDGKGRARRGWRRWPAWHWASPCLARSVYPGRWPRMMALVGGGDAEAIVNSIIQQVFAEIFGGGVVDDDAAVSGGGDINVGGSTGSTVTMGGGSGGSVNMGGGSSGGSGGGAMMGDDSGG